MGAQASRPPGCPRPPPSSIPPCTPGRTRGYWAVTTCPSQSLCTMLSSPHTSLVKQTHCIELQTQARTHLLTSIRINNEILNNESTEQKNSRFWREEHICTLYHSQVRTTPSCLQDSLICPEYLRVCWQVKLHHSFKQGWREGSVRVKSRGFTRDNRVSGIRCSFSHLLEDPQRALFPRAAPGPTSRLDSPGNGALHFKRASEILPPPPPPPPPPLPLLLHSCLRVGSTCVKQTRETEFTGSVRFSEAAEQPERSTCSQSTRSSGRRRHGQGRQQQPVRGSTFSCI